jgi:uncharacterized protein DUF5313
MLIMTTKVKRPNPVRWAWYALGGRLPETYREWVLHDLTARTWLWRHAARSSVLLAPLCLVWLLLPGPLWIRLLMVALAVIVGYFYSFVYSSESAEHRLVKHGYPQGTGKQVRAEARADVEEEIRQRYIATWRNQEQ